MRTKLLVAFLAGGCLLGLQAAAFAQEQSGLDLLPRESYTAPDAWTAPVYPFVQGQSAQPLYNYYSGPRRGAVVSRRHRQQD